MCTEAATRGVLYENDNIMNYTTPHITIFKGKLRTKNQQSYFFASENDYPLHILFIIHLSSIIHYTKCQKLQSKTSEPRISLFIPKCSCKLGLLL